LTEYELAEKQEKNDEKESDMSDKSVGRNAEQIIKVLLIFLKKVIMMVLKKGLILERKSRDNIMVTNKGCSLFVSER